MGLIKDALSSAMGADQVKNGFNGPHLSKFSAGKRFQDSGYARPTSPSYRNSPPPQQPYYQTPADRGSYFDADKEAPPAYYRDAPSSYRDAPSSYRDAPASYSNATPSNMEWQGYQHETYGGRRSPRYQDRTRDSRFRPLALPQVTYGDGQPFLRGYSDELMLRGISEQTLLAILDDINVAIIPNPEVQIFQKGASIAGWFIPGAAGLGLMAGQVVVGVGSALGHSSLVSRSLSKANLETFLPKGLEICIAKTKDVNAEVGYSPAPRSDRVTARPESRIAAYGDLVAPLTVVMPPLEHVGRRDPIAMIGRGLSSKETNKKMEKAQEKMERGRRNKDLNGLEDGFKWIMVREAKPDTLAHWQRVLQESEAALQQEAAGGTSSGGPSPGSKRH